MKIDLTSDAAEWVRAEISSGRFATAEEAVSHAIEAEKLRWLREELAAAEAEGGEFSADEVMRFAMDHLDSLTDPASPPR